MNTDKSKKFTNKVQADRIAKNRNKQVYLLGNKKGKNVYYVGDYDEAMKAKNAL